MNEHALPLFFKANLPDRLQKRLAFDVAYRAAYLRYHHLGAALLPHGIDKALDLVCDMRYHLHRPAQIGALALFFYHVVIDLARGEIGILVGVFVDKALVMPKVEICLRAVLGDENFPVLIRAHRPRIHVDIRVELLRRHFQAL